MPSGNLKLYIAVLVFVVLFVVIQHDKILNWLNGDDVSSAVHSEVHRYPYQQSQKQLPRDDAHVALPAADIAAEAKERHGQNYLGVEHDVWKSRRVKDNGQEQAGTDPAVSDELRRLKDQVARLEKKIAKLETQSSVGQKPKTFPPTKTLKHGQRKRILITGGAGFVGSHLVDALMFAGHEVIVLDNFYTGRKRNVEHWFGHPNFELVHHDVVHRIEIQVDQIYHLASPASPPHYMHNPIKTIKANTIGTLNMLDLARIVRGKILLASTSEVYGDPEVHPQPETYWGHVNPNGPRACYDESKRIAETLMMAYHKRENVSIRIARIFNTYGERMHMNDGRVVSNFILQAIQDHPITMYGNGEQTRSLQYVSDLVNGLIRLMESNVTDPVNLGNPEEHTVAQFAQIVKKLTGSSSEIVSVAPAEDDPQRRRPDITRANRRLNWAPQVGLEDGLKKTIAYFKEELRSGDNNYNKLGTIVSDNQGRKDVILSSDNF